jgi:bifunctional non-homologous end joining protein LigD
LITTNLKGTIPKGQYGGGTVMIWDQGKWIPEGDPKKALSKGQLTFQLDGKKLHGSWHLVRLGKRPHEKREPWLLIKSKDEASLPASAPDILATEPLSAVTGRSMDEITAGTKKIIKKHSSQKLTPRKAALKPRKIVSPQKSKKISQRKTTIASLEKTPEARQKPLPDFVPPSLATLSAKAPKDSAWVHEIKFDGYRLQARIDGKKISFRTRTGLDWTRKFTSVQKALAALPAQKALIDGELVVENDTGVSSFEELQNALKQDQQARFVYYVFDLLYLDGYDLRATPLEMRKRTLKTLIKKLPKDTLIRYSQDFDDQGPLLLDHACRLSLEGVVSKRRDAPYHSGRAGDWVKTKCMNEQEFVIAGYKNSAVLPHAVGSLILAYSDNGKLRYAGRSGTGYSQQQAQDMWKKFQKYRVSTCPFDRVPAEETQSRGAVWLCPKLVAEIQFATWTGGGLVRHGAFKGLREDKPAKQIVREKPIYAVASPKVGLSGKKGTPPSPKPPAKIKGKNSLKASTDSNVTLTHGDRVYWEEDKITKQQLAAYYDQAWEWMSPYLLNRPLSLVRCPEGAGTECFFQKHAAMGLKNSHLTIRPDEKGREVLAIHNKDGLFSLVQAGVLELHLWGTTIDKLDSCNLIVMDLDPGPDVTWQQIRDAAIEVRERLSQVGLTSFLKTSGGKGLHVTFSIKPVSWDTAKSFAQTLARAMAADRPDLYTAVMTKSLRAGRIFVDYLRNGRGATAIAPYSTRARPGAPIATPLAWDELSRLKSGNQYTLLNIPRRLKKLRSDPWQDLSKLKQSLPSFKA